MVVSNTNSGRPSNGSPKYLELGGDSSSNGSSSGSELQGHNWTRVLIGILMVWVFATIMKESGAFSSLTSNLNLQALGSTPPPREVEFTADWFVTKHTAIDELMDEIEEEVRNGTADMASEEGENIVDISEELHRARNLSSLPRTSNYEYNVLEKGKKYFLYSPSGGFNNQLICLVNAMTLARRLKRILIVPGAGKHANLFRGYLRLKQNEIVPMDHTLDFAHMEKVAGIKMLPLNITVNEFQRLYLSVSSSKTKKKNTSVVKLPNGGLMKPSDPGVWKRIVWKAHRSHMQVVWFRGRFFTAHWLNKNYWQNARYSPYLQELAFTVSRDLFNNHYNSIHIRLGDYKTRSMKRSADASTYLKSAIKIGFEKHIPVYIASEEGRESPYFKPLIDYFDTVVFQQDLLQHKATRKALIDYTLRTPSTAIRNDLFGLAEQLICARARLFVGTRISTFSKTIKVIRQKLSAAIPDLYDELLAKKKFCDQNNQTYPLRITAQQRWNGVMQISRDTLRPNVIK